jgi:hypothetical protein
MPTAYHNDPAFNHLGYSIGNQDSFVWGGHQLVAHAPASRTPRQKTSTQPPWPSPPPWDASPHVYNAATTSPYLLKDDIVKLEKQRRRIALLQTRLMAALENSSASSPSTPSACRPRPQTARAVLQRPDPLEAFVGKYDGWTYGEPDSTLETPSSPLHSGATSSRAAGNELPAPRPARPHTAGARGSQCPPQSSQLSVQRQRPSSARALASHERDHPLGAHDECACHPLAIRQRVRHVPPNSASLPVQSCL